MDPTTWITAVVLVLLIVVLVREMLPPSAALLGALVALVLLRVTDPAEAFVGFSNTATITVAGLFVVAHAVQRHAGLDRVLQRALNGARSERGLLVRLCVPLAATSAVVANTPLVAGLAPVVRTWADRHGVPASRLLMPLSFATILGGLITTIGTSTTLVASGVVAQRTGTPFGVLEVTRLGLPFAVIGTAVLVLLAPRLLPTRAGAVLRPGDKRYSFRLIVESGGPLDGKKLGDAGLRDLEEVFVAAIHRGRTDTVPARPDMRLAGGDELVVVGDVRSVLELPVAGLRHADEQQVAELDAQQTGLHEVVLGPTSSLRGRTLKDVSFRGRYDAAVLAINRAEHRLEGKLGTIPLEAGDALLLQAGPDFVDRWRDSAEFAVVAGLDDELSEVSGRRWLVLAVALAMIGVAGFGVVSLVEAVLWACVALLVTGTLGFREALESLDLDVLLIIAAAIGLGSVVESSGIAADIAAAISRLGVGAGPLLALVAILLSTALLTELVTNVASVALMVPIALRTAEAVGEDPRAWAIAAALAASTSFLTPIGYQTNTIVYGMGGYRFGDYWRLGLPLVLIWIVTATLLVPVLW